MDKSGGSGGLDGAQAQIQRASEQVVIAVSVRITTATTTRAATNVFRRTAGRVQHVSGRVEVRVKTKTGKMFLKQRIGRGRVQVHFLPGVFDQIRELNGRIQQRSGDRYSIGGCHSRWLLLLVMVRLVVLLMVVVMVVERMSGGAGCVRLE